MKRQKMLIVLAIPFLLIHVSLLNIAYANEDDVNLLDFPKQLATRLGIPVVAGEMLATSIIVMIYLFPTLILTRNAMAHLVMAILALSTSIAIGWIGIFPLLIYCVSIAVIFGGKVRKWLSGR